VTRAE